MKSLKLIISMAVLTIIFAISVAIVQAQEPAVLCTFSPPMSELDFYTCESGHKLHRTEGQRHEARTVWVTPVGMMQMFSASTSPYVAEIRIGGQTYMAPTGTIIASNHHRMDTGAWVTYGWGEWKVKVYNNPDRIKILYLINDDLGINIQKVVQGLGDLEFQIYDSGIFVIWNGATAFDMPITVTGTGALTISSGGHSNLSPNFTLDNYSFEVDASSAPTPEPTPSPMPAAPSIALSDINSDTAPDLLQQMIDWLNAVVAWIRSFCPICN